MQVPRMCHGVMAFQFPSHKLAYLQMLIVFYETMLIYGHKKQP